jgi:hypothetical protein
LKTQDLSLLSKKAMAGAHQPNGESRYSVDNLILQNSWRPPGAQRTDVIRQVSPSNESLLIDAPSGMRMALLATSMSRRIF